jgi:ribonuclease HI
MMSIVVNCDGLCEPRNPGGIATFGWLARRDGEVIGSGCGVVAKGPKATNNLAEYTAVIRALEWLLDEGFAKEVVRLRSDSQLVIY